MVHSTSNFRRCKFPPERHVVLRSDAPETAMQEIDDLRSETETPFYRMHRVDRWTPLGHAVPIIDTPFKVLIAPDRSGCFRNGSTPVCFRHGRINMEPAPLCTYNNTVIQWHSLRLFGK